MTTFITFTETRKKLIDFHRNRVMTLRPTFDATYGNKQQALYLADYVVYAALRGADYRKGDHTGGDLADKALAAVIKEIVYFGTSPSWRGRAIRERLLGEADGSTVTALDEIKGYLEEELAKRAGA